MSKNFGFSKFDRIILSGAVVGLTALGYLLYDDSILTQSARFRDTQNSLGRIESTTHDVRQKYNSDFEWNAVKISQPVFLGDSLFTGENSTATLELKDGSKITIEENSLVTMSSRHNQLMLDFKFGNFTGDIAENSNLKIRTEDEVVEIKPEPEKKARVQIRKTKRQKIAVKSVANTPITSTPQSVRPATPPTSFPTIAAPKPVAIAPTPASTPPPAAVLPPREYKLIAIEPIDQQVFYPHATKAIKFKWTADQDLKKFIVEFSDSPSFEKILNKVTVNSAFELTSPLDNLAASSSDSTKQDKLVRYWRVHAVDNSDKILISTANQSYVVQKMETPKIISPLMNSVLHVHRNLDHKILDTDQVKVEFSYSTKCQIEYSIATDSRFTKEVEHKTISTFTTLSSHLKENTYYIRARALTQSIATPWSEPNVFAVQIEEPKEGILPPKLTQQHIKFTPPADLESPPKPNQSPTISWKKSESAAQYKFEISRSADFANAQIALTSNLSHTWTNFSPGMWYFRISSLTEGGRLSKSSSAGDIEVLLPKLTLNKVAPIRIISKKPRDAATPQNTKLSWSPVPFAKSYKIQVSQNSDFSNSKEVISRAPASDYTIEAPGNYKWRVMALNENNEPLGETSEPDALIYDFKNRLAPPVLVEPKDKSIVTLQADIMPFIWLEWELVSSSSHYIIEIARDPEFKKKLTSKVDGKRFLLKQGLINGTYYWRVKSEAGDQTSEWSPIFKFNIKLVKDK